MGQFRGFQIASGAIASHHLVNDIAIRGLFSVQSGVTLSGTLVVHSGVEFKNDLFVSGNTSLTGTLGVSGAATLASTLNVASGVVLSDTLSVASGATFLSGASFAKEVVMSENLRVSGTSILNDLQVTGSAIFSGNVTITGTLGVSGASSLAAVTATGAVVLTDTLAVSGTSELRGAVTALNNMNVSGTSELRGAVTALGAMNVSGTSELRGAVTALDAMNVSGTSELRGAVTALDAMNVSGASTLRGEVTALGAMNVSGAAAFGSTVLLAQDPTLAFQAATKRYVDHVSQGLTIKETVRVLASGSLAAVASASAVKNDYDEYFTVLTSSASEALEIDSVALDVNDRVLVKGQADAKFNGLYIVTDAGSVSTSWVLERSTDANTSSELPVGSYVLITEGTEFGGTSWVLTSFDGALAVAGAGDSINWTQFAGAGVIQGARNIYVDGNNVYLGDQYGSNLTGAVAVSGATSSLAIMSGASASIAATSSLAIQSGASLGLEADSSSTIYSGSSVVIESGALFAINSINTSGAALAKLFGNHVVSGADSLHSHALGALGIKEPLAYAEHVASDAASLVVALAAGFDYTVSNFAVASGAGLSWSSSDLEVYLNGQLLEYNHAAASLDMPRFSFDRTAEEVTVLGGVVSGDHVYVRYFAKSENV